MSHSQDLSREGVALDDKELQDAKLYVAGARPDIRDEKDVLHVLVRDGWNDVVRGWMDKWLADPSNIERAERTVRRKRQLNEELHLAFCMFTLPSFDSGSGKVLPDMRMTVRKADQALDHSPQTIVFVAIDDLGADNGFFTTLRAGCYVCKDSIEPLWFPATGGGRGLVYWLRL